MYTHYLLASEITLSFSTRLVWGIAVFLIFIPDLSLASDASAESFNQNSSYNDWITIITNMLSGVFGALIGALGISVQAKLARSNELKLMADQDKLCRINDQISKFYAPLLTISMSAKKSWKKFCEEQKRSNNTPLDFFEKNEKEEPDAVTGENLLNYIRVMKEVFSPLNKQRMEIILSNAALIDNTEDVSGGNIVIPDYLIDLVIHVSELNAMMKRWEKISEAQYALSYVSTSNTVKEKYAAFYPSCEFPGNLNEELQKKYNCLLKEKNAFLMN